MQQRIEIVVRDHCRSLLWYWLGEADLGEAPGAGNIHFLHFPYPFHAQRLAVHEADKCLARIDIERPQPSLIYGPYGKREAFLIPAKQGANMATTGVMRPGHIQLRVLDLEESVDFYRQVLGLAETGRDSAGRFQGLGRARPSQRDPP